MSHNNHFQLAWDVISEVERQGGFVFGGFVRDYLAGDDFNNIDIFFPGDFSTSSTVMITVHELLRQGMSCKAGSSFTCFFPDLWRRRYIIISTDGKTSVNVDFYQRFGGNAASVPFCKGSDIDINNLYMKFGIYLWGQYPSNLNDVLDNINKRQFEAESTVSQTRIYKMVQRGYKRVNGPSVQKPSIQNIVNNNIYSNVKNILDTHTDKQEKKVVFNRSEEMQCKVCGRKVTIDEPQCWWCGVNSPGRK